MKKKLKIEFFLPVQSTFFLLKTENKQVNWVGSSKLITSRYEEKVTHLRRLSCGFQVVFDLSGESAYVGSS